MDPLSDPDLSATARTLAGRVLAGPARLGPVRLVCIDGPAGSGKTTTAAALVASLQEHRRAVEVVHLDDLYEGWSGLEGSLWPRLAAQVLRRLAPQNPRALTLAARELGARGMRDEALALATRATVLEPWLPAAHEVIASASFEAGQCDRALAAQRRALSLLAEAPPPVREEAKARLDQWARECAAGRPAKASE